MQILCRFKNNVHLCNAFPYERGGLTPATIFARDFLCPYIQCLLGTIKRLEFRPSWLLNGTTASFKVESRGERNSFLFPQCFNLMLSIMNTENIETRERVNLVNVFSAAMTRGEVQHIYDFEMKMLREDGTHHFHEFQHTRSQACRSFSSEERDIKQKIYVLEQQLITARERKHRIIEDARDTYEVRCISNRERREDIRHQYNLRMVELATEKGGTK